MMQLDHSLFFFLNGWHSPESDVFWGIVTHRFTWIPLYFILILVILWKVPKGGVIIAYFLVSVGVADRFTSGLMKPTFKRLRPCHNVEMVDRVHVIGSCGGQYGFASSHAANTFALAMAFSLTFPRQKRIKYSMWGWAFLVSISRVFVGAHFPGDLIVGALVGVFFSWVIFRLIQSRWINYTP
ncbi:MAG: phosphatase PAP2 family protein [Spirosomataceae bacterium]